VSATSGLRWSAAGNPLAGGAIVAGQSGGRGIRTHEELAPLTVFKTEPGVSASIRLMPYRPFYLRKHHLVHVAWYAQMCHLPLHPLAKCERADSVRALSDLRSLTLPKPRMRGLGTATDK